MADRPLYRDAKPAIGLGVLLALGSLGGWTGSTAGQVSAFAFAIALVTAIVGRFALQLFADQPFWEIVGELLAMVLIIGAVGATLVFTRNRRAEVRSLQQAADIQQSGRTTPN